MTKQQKYPTDLTDEQVEFIKQFLPASSALAKRFTNSTEEAEKAVLNIFNEIWKRAELYDSAKCTEREYVLQTVYRQLFKHSGRNSH